MFTGTTLDAFELRRNIATRPIALTSVISAIMAGQPFGIAHAQEAQDEVIVTGSRIARRDLSASSPLVTVESSTFEDTSQIGVEAALNRLPQFSGGGATGDGTQFDNGDVQASAFNTPGAASINLRGLGSNRNLVLIDGRRAQPINATLIVDVNTIPAAAIESVEIITGGASAVYGADALAGVTNFRFKRAFEGIDLDLQSGTTDAGDGSESRLSALLGSNVGDNGNVMVGIEWAQRDAAFDAEREFYRKAWSDPGTPGQNFITPTEWAPTFGNAPTQAAVDSVFGAGTNVSPTSSFFVNLDDTLFKRSPMTRYNGPMGPDFKVLNNGTLAQNFQEGLTSSPLQRYSAFGRGRLEIGDDVALFVQANYASIEVDAVSNYSPATGLWGAQIPYDSAHPVPAELATLLDSRPDPTAPWQLNRVLDFLGPQKSVNSTNVNQILAGVEGTFTNRDWTWEAYASHGNTNVLSHLVGGFASLQRYRTVVTAPNYGRDFARDVGLGFTINCTSGLPIFDDFTPSQDCIDAIVARMKNTTALEQTIAEFNMQGALADMRFGELRFALGTSYRENTALFEPDLLNDAESIIENPVGLFAANNAGGSTDVAEIYGELLVPIASSLDLELGYRYSDYDTAGGVDTYRVMFDWRATGSVRIRGGRQHATRAPNVGELFTGPTLAVVSFPGSDPCTNVTTNPWGNVATNPNRAQVQGLCSALIGNPASPFDANPDGFTGIFGFFPSEIENRRGSPDVASEEAETWTLGVVWLKEQWSVSADVYTIEIADAIAPLSSYTAYQKCFNADGISNPTYSIDDPGEFCRLIVRSAATGDRFQVISPYRNLGGIETSGLDVQLNWAGSGDRTRVNVALTYLDEFQTQATPDAPFLDAAGTLDQGGQYRWRALTTVARSLGDSVNIGLIWRHLPDVKDVSAARNPATTVDDVKSYDVFDLFGGWQISETLAMRFGVDNVFDADPRIVGADPPNTNASGQTFPGYYDTLGRRYFAGLKVSF